MNNPSCPRAVVLHLDVSCKWNRPATHAARCKETPSFCICFPKCSSWFSPIYHLYRAALLVGDDEHGFLLPRLCSSLCTQETALQQSSAAEGFANAGHVFCCFIAFQLGFGCWHRVAVLGLSCPEEREVLAANPAWVPRLSAARD